MDRSSRRAVIGTFTVGAAASGAVLLLFLFDRLAEGGLIAAIVVIAVVEVIIVVNVFRRARERAARRAQTRSSLDPTASTDPGVNEVGYDPMGRFRSPNE